MTWVYIVTGEKIDMSVTHHEYISMGILDQKQINIIRFISHQTSCVALYHYISRSSIIQRSVAGLSYNTPCHPHIPIMY